MPAGPVYSASKHGVVGFTRCIGVRLLKAYIWKKENTLQQYHVVIFCATHAHTHTHTHTHCTYACIHTYIPTNTLYNS